MQTLKRRSAAFMYILAVPLILACQEPLAPDPATFVVTTDPVAEEGGGSLDGGEGQGGKKQQSECRKHGARGEKELCVAQ